MLDEFGPTGHVQHHLAAQGHVGIGGIEQHGPDLLADLRSAGLSDFAHADPSLTTRVGEPGELGRLARPVGAVENQEPTGEACDPIAHRGDYAL